MQRYSFFVNHQNFYREKLEFYVCFNSCLQLKHCIVDAHIIILYTRRYTCGGKRLSGDGRSLTSPDQIPYAARSDSVRRPIRFRSPPDQIPFATRSDSVRRPIRFRTPPDQIPYANRSDFVRRSVRSCGDLQGKSNGLAARKQRFGTAKHQQKSSASTITSIRVGRYEHPRRSVRMSASVDTSICVGRCG